jgi:hypothetical protein
VEGAAAPVVAGGVVGRDGGTVVVDAGGLGLFAAVLVLSERFVIAKTPMMTARATRAPITHGV